MSLEGLSANSGYVYPQSSIERAELALMKLPAVSEWKGVSARNRLSRIEFDARSNDLREFASCTLSVSIVKVAYLLPAAST